ncbi:hypothetical protein [Actinomadura rupiterrae]|uniref:hypothetical protein n=1 Tax=Actinomadura rupiterrae TaxID=559627 RepID=UPI0020A3AA80|nr:hypothetical protein [Actinomadura rupiterrae]MCP2340445.1 hypothetical protein [Actinomadura rupiterrae]
MRRRIVCGLALAALPIAAGVAAVPSWPHLPSLTSHSSAKSSHAAAFAAGDRSASAGASHQAHQAPAGGGGRALVGTALRPSSLSLLGDLGKRLTNLTGRMEHAARGLPLTQEAAEQLLTSNHIQWRSNGNCHERSNPNCTAFQGLLRGSMDDLLDFGRTSGCPLTVSGGTEQGHAPGKLSHGTGHKIDVMPTQCLDTYIPGHFQHTGVRGDNAELYRSPSGDVFARETDHWDILVPR